MSYVISTAGAARRCQVAARLQPGADLLGVAEHACACANGGLTLRVVMLDRTSPVGAGLHQPSRPYVRRVERGCRRLFEDHELDRT
jgi:hypothetical protein